MDCSTCHHQCECHLRQQLERESRNESRHVLSKVSLAVLGCLMLLLAMTAAQSLQLDALPGADTRELQRQSEPWRSQVSLADEALQGEIDVVKANVASLQKIEENHAERLVALEGVLFRLEGGGGAIALVLAILQILQLRENKRRGLRTRATYKVGHDADFETV